MAPTRLLVFYLLLAASASLVRGTKDEAAAGAGDNSTEDTTISDDQRRVYQECRNPDYKQYLKCLMRPKRHHHDRGDTSPDSDTVHCLSGCLSKCGPHIDQECEKKCSHCTRKIRYRHQFIAEVEKECDSGKCVSVNDGLRTTNITTNIGINNVIKTWEPGTPVHPNGTPNGIPNGIPNGAPNGIPGHPYPPWNIPSLPIIPQISLVPQITYGIGAAGGCGYNQWLCIQQTGAQIPRHDCSGCGNPVLRYTCDVTCYATHINATTKPRHGAK